MRRLEGVYLENASLEEIGKKGICKKKKETKLCRNLWNGGKQQFCKHTEQLSSENEVKII
jgi:hypothetical protein